MLEFVAGFIAGWFLLQRPEFVTLVVTELKAFFTSQPKE